MNKVLFFALVLVTTLFAADDNSNNDKKALLEKFLKEHPEFRYQPRTARRINLFEGVQLDRFAEQELRSIEELRASVAQLAIKKDNQG